MTNPRAGLIREGFRTYIVPGPNGVWAIDRDKPRRFYVRPRDWPRNGFFAMAFARLREARAYAEDRAGDAFPDPHMPKFLRRYQPKRVAG